MKKFKMISVVLAFILVAITFNYKPSQAAEIGKYEVNLSNLDTYTVNGAQTVLITYSQEDFDTFLSDYNSGNLPAIYVTEFLFDGVGMVKTPDLDDFEESGNDAKIKTLDIKAINVNTTGNIEFSGEITGGMIAVDTNGRAGEINLILNGVKIDTDSKKTPAIYVFNKDITYTGCKVTIKTASGTKNYIDGGKLKKVSLIGSDELSNYTSKYSGDSQTWYTTYTNYYGIYTSEQINNVLFAKVQADNEDLADGDPYYFYKAAGAISSDIDLYFEGTGYLELKSKNKEGVETKGNLTFSGGTGDYVVYAKDDCLNTTTDSKTNTSARNTLTIDVNSLYAIVDSGEDADEGDAIDSNGTLNINGGTIVAIAHPGQDAGLDSEKGIFINGGTVLATGDMCDAISNESKQNFMVLNFQGAQKEGTLITLLNDNDEIVMAYKTDRLYTNLVYSSDDLVNGTYYVYKDGEIEGSESYGYYTTVNGYTKGTMQGYSSTGTQGGMTGGMPGGNMNNQDGTRPELPDMSGEESDGNAPSGNMQTRPSGNIGDMQSSSGTASNKDFVINGISNQFSGVADYQKDSNASETNANGDSDDGTEANTILPKTGVIAISVVGIVIFATLAVVCLKKINIQ